jgi:hypothetical protein
VPETIPDHVLSRFGNPKARPQITRVYSSAAGWVDVPGKRLLTREAMAMLAQAGNSMVEARWHWHTKEFSLVRLRDTET